MTGAFNCPLPNINDVLLNTGRFVNTNQLSPGKETYNTMTSSSTASDTNRSNSEISDEEWKSRSRLAACYHIFEHLGWTETIYAHITLKIPDRDNQFLINPWGLRYDEVSASNLVAIDLEGNRRDTSAHPVNRAGYVIHGAIHAARPDLKCVMHTHTTAGMAVAAQQQGLLPISIMSTGYYGRIAYHDYEGPSLERDEQERLIASLGANKKVMILRNHGLVDAGSTIEEAFILMFRLQRACEIQIAAQAGGSPLNIPAADVCEQSAERTDTFLNSNESPIGKLEFDSYVRLLEEQGKSFSP